MADLECDVAIIGAGTAGLAAERSARRAGAKTLLIDERFSGTTCASVGCMPSKLLIAASKSAHAVTCAEIFGIHAASVSIDGRAVMRRVRSLRDGFVAATHASIDKLPDASRLTGIAAFTSPDTLAVEGTSISAKAIVIATGSAPAIPNTFSGLDNVLTNNSVFELEDLPVSLAVIGAGPLGLELAQAFSRLGVDVELFDQSDRIAGLEDAAVAETLRDVLQKEFPLHLGTEVAARAATGGMEISWSGSSTGCRTFSHVLVAAGRPPDLERLQLERSGLALDKHGTPVFDRDTMQCGSSPIFLAGDCDADAPVLHEASAEGAIAGNNAARYPDVKPSRRSTRLAITFTDPPSASIGTTGDNAIVGESDYSDQGRAKVEGRDSGLVRLYSDNDGRLTGAAMAAPGAEHMAHLLAWAIENGQTAMQLLELPTYHPTFEEGLRAALRQICDQINISFSSDRDGGSSPGI